MDQSNPMFNDVIKNFYLTLNLKDENELSEYLKRYDFDIIDIKKKLKLKLHGMT